MKNARSDICSFVHSQYVLSLYVPVEADVSPSVACSIGVAHQSRPVVGVIALPFLNQIVRPKPPARASLIASTQPTKAVEHL
jgi:hypothetical protein